MSDSRLICVPYLHARIEEELASRMRGYLRVFSNKEKLLSNNVNINFGDLDLDVRIKSHKDMGLRAWNGLVYMHTYHQQRNR